MGPHSVLEPLKLKLYLLCVSLRMMEISSLEGLHVGSVHRSALLCDLRF